ncbi:hypothetical protein SAMN05216526_1537 [Ectothiorhodosinus mongolicus]|uniref:Cupin domain-containing protein n=1 Tax=Ectothiorhodosinus mongolicus TaxID=233100 RepID=A0A1R3W310_9GAMM|nr:cupin domain-containing protein [Ectothiorhodosinus mongolicus]ULX57391.1 cupin domain-containing protein [Ectothiorhodosinus mongolicus]SIT71350.1 hypothetical protein SAMN05216526_1537 [Ectothiorhodosinus mongolicus]
MKRLTTLISSALLSGVLAFSSVSAGGHAAQAYEQILATPLDIQMPNRTVLGQEYRFPTGEPDIRGFLIEIPVGKETSLHTHAIPLLAYVVSGTLEVDYGSKGKRTFGPGSTYIEAIDWCHVGRALGDEPAIILGFYLGSDDPPHPLATDC